MSTGYTVRTDGASRGNPGPSSIGVVIEDAQGREVATASEAIGTTTNNVAEYTALERAVEMLKELGATEADFYLDSQLIVRQLNGEYRVKNDKLRPIYARIRTALTRMDRAELHHVPREENHRADALANEALDALL